MYLLRRTAAHAISTPSRTLFLKPRSIATYIPSFRSGQQKWTAPAFQRRFASDEVAKADGTLGETAETAAAAAESFAQTIPEAPVEENLTPAQANAQAPPTDASATAGFDALEAAAQGASRGERQSPSASRLGFAAPSPSNIVYVGNLYYEVTEDQLKRVFSRFGEVENVKIVFDNRGLSRGFAYVEYDSADNAQAAVDNLDMQVFEGRNLVVQFHRPKSAPPGRSNSDSVPNGPTKTLFIGNMSFEMSDKDLNDLFRDIRNVMDVRVAIDRRTGQPRGFAHADFIDVASATKAMDVLKGKVIYGRELRIDFSKSGSQMQRDRRADRV